MRRVTRAPRRCRGGASRPRGGCRRRGGRGRPPRWCRPGSRAAPAMSVSRSTRPAYRSCGRPFFRSARCWQDSSCAAPPVRLGECSPLPGGRVSSGRRPTRRWRRSGGERPRRRPGVRCCRSGNATAEGSSRAWPSFRNAPRASYNSPATRGLGLKHIRKERILLTGEPPGSA